MDEKKLDEKLDQRFAAMTETIMNGIGELHQETMKGMQNVKQDIFDKIGAIRGELLDKLATKTSVQKLEDRVKVLETQ